MQAFNDVAPNRIFVQNVYLNEEGVRYTREVYNILGILGDLGGIVEVIMIIFGFFLFPISEHSFYLKAGRLLFFARTKEQDVFLKNGESDEEDKLEKYLDPSKFAQVAGNKLMSEIKKHHIIRISKFDNVRLFLSNLFSSLCCSCCWKRKEKFQSLYEQC